MPINPSHTANPIRFQSAPSGPSLFAADFEKSIAELLDQKLFTQACDRIAALLQDVVNHHKLVGNYIFLPRIDALLVRLAQLLLPDIPASTHSRRAPIIVATKLHSDGGHTRIIEELVGMDNRTSIILTNYFGDSGKPSSLPPAVGNLPITVLPHDSPENNILRLNNLCSHAASHIFLLCHQHDVVANTALIRGLNARVFFIHHSDHRPSIGSTIESFVHVDVAPHMQDLCSRSLHCKTLYWPQGVQDRGQKTFSYPLLKPVSVSAGTPNKFAWDGPLAYPLLVTSILSSGIDSHFHIGELSTSQLQLIATQLTNSSIPLEKFLYLGRVHSVWQCLLDYPIQLFIGSAPLHGLRTAIEAQGAGIPLIVFKQAPTSIMSESGIYNSQTDYYHSPGDIGPSIARVLADHPHKASSARLHYQSSFTPEIMRHAINHSLVRFS